MQLLDTDTYLQLPPNEQLAHAIRLAEEVEEERMNDILAEFAQELAQTLGTSEDH